MSDVWGQESGPMAGWGPASVREVQVGAPLDRGGGDNTFDEVVTASVLPVLVDVWAPWCGPCRAISPALERLANDKAGQIKLVKINADEAPQLSARFGIQAIPTLLILRGQKVISRQTGAAPESHLRDWVEEVLSSAPSGRGSANELGGQ